MRSTSRRENATGDAGVVRPETGHRQPPSPSIQSATSLSGRQRRQFRFPVRSASPLSRPDLAAPKPRRATKEMGGAEPPGATRRAPWRTSMARMASTAPSRSEHRGTLTTSRKIDPPAASAANSAIGESLHNPCGNYLDTHRRPRRRPAPYSPAHTRNLRSTPISRLSRDHNSPPSRSPK